MYKKSHVKLPRLAGTPLRVLGSALDIPGLGDAIRASMLGSVGIAELRRTPVEAPAWTPTRLVGREAGHDGGRASGAAGSSREVDLDAVAGLAATPAPGGPASCAAYARAYRERRAGPLEIAEAVLRASSEAEALSPPLRALIFQDPDDVRAQARASQQRLDKRQPLSVLDGVPVVIKDEVDVRGYATNAGTRFLGQDKAREDAHAVKRLRAAGALIVGKTNMHELGIGVTGSNPHHGTARNPHDLSRATGGSSSGTGAAVAAGLAPLGLGADGGGSIRTPSSMCGVVGLKPTFGRVSEQGAAAICWSVAHIGPMGATARDCALGYAVMAGRDPGDPQTHQQPPVTLPVLDGNVEGVRLGVFRPWFEDADADVVEACWEGMKALERRGAVIVDIEIPDLERLRVVHVLSIGIEMAASQLAHWDAHKDDYALDTKINLSLARSLPASDYVHAQRHRTVLCDHFDRALEKVDAICTPTVGCTAPPVLDDALATGESDLGLLLKIMRFAPAANVTGLPAISMPSGQGQGGLPVGLMAMGRAWEEGLLLRLAAALELEVPPRLPQHHWRILG
jgi:Asp-tRNA(Asn)/Glu-tRNA(Gln) amidotransferase A subunit family amidase